MIWRRARRAATPCLYHKRGSWWAEACGRRSELHVDLAFGDEVLSHRAGGGRVQAVGSELTALAS